MSLFKKKHAVYSSSNSINKRYMCDKLRLIQEYYSKGFHRGQTKQVSERKTERRKFPKNQQNIKLLQRRCCWLTLKHLVTVPKIENVINRSTVLNLAITLSIKLSLYRVFMGIVRNKVHVLASIRQPDSSLWSNFMIPFPNIDFTTYI